MMATSKAVLDAMREDFEQLPPDARAKLLDMLCASGVESPPVVVGCARGRRRPAIPRARAAQLVRLHIARKKAVYHIDRRPFFFGHQIRFALAVVPPILIELLVESAFLAPVLGRVGGGRHRERDKVADGERNPSSGHICWEPPHHHGEHSQHGVEADAEQEQAQRIRHALDDRGREEDELQRRRADAGSEQGPAVHDTLFRFFAGEYGSKGHAHDHNDR